MSRIKLEVGQSWEVAGYHGPWRFTVVRPERDGQFTIRYLDGAEAGDEVIVSEPPDGLDIKLLDVTAPTDMAVPNGQN